MVCLAARSKKYPYSDIYQRKQVPNAQTHGSCPSHPDAVSIGNRESPVCIFISDIKQGRPFLMFKIQCLHSQRLQFPTCFNVNLLSQIPAAVSHLPPSTALYLPFFYHASCHHSSAVFSLYLLYKSTSYISIEKAHQVPLCSGCASLIHKSIIYSFRSTSCISYRFRMNYGSFG